jgi:thiopeptide-type bacteriocin biosynthesis protein
MKPNVARVAEKSPRPSSRVRLLYKPFDFVFVRAPFLPVETYLSISKDGSVSHDALLRDDCIRCALAIGSPHLLDAFEQTSSESARASDLIEKLQRYLIRMATRPTPFGLFAGVGLAEWGSYTDLALTDAPLRTRSRPDMTWLFSVVMMLEARPEVRRELRFFANCAAFLADGRMHLTEPAPGTGGHANTSIRATDAVRVALAGARRPILYRDLATLLLDKIPQATGEKVDALLTQLWQLGFLFTDLRPPLTIENPARYVADRLRSVAAGKASADQIEATLRGVAAWDRSEGRKSIDLYRAAVSQAKTVSIAAGDTPFVVDAALSLDGRRIARAVGEEAARTAEVLLRISPAPLGLQSLEAYRRLFVGRYGLTEVPLLELLDAQFGGLGAPNPHGSGGTLPAATVARRAQTLLDLAVIAVRDGRHVINLDAATLSLLETWRPTSESAPPTLELYAFVAAQSNTAIDSGEFELVIGPNLGAMGAGRNLGRFADLLAPGASHALQSVARAEESNDLGRIWAELVYLPQPLHAANVVVRAPVRSHEIVIGVPPGIDNSLVIPLDELVVGVSAGRFYLRWTKRDLEVVVCSGHMLNTIRAPAVCRFLADLSRDGVAQLAGFDWGPASAFPFLPRVTFEKAVLSPARWRLDSVTCQRAFGELENSRTFEAQLREWRGNWRVPRYVYLSAGDNRLMLDLEQRSQIAQLREELSKANNGIATILQEVHPSLDQTWLSGPGGRYLAELVISLRLRRPQRPRSAAVDRRARSQVVPVTRAPAPDAWKLRPPGSEWLFAKVYSPPVFHDDLIAYSIHPFAQRVVGSALAQQWFFIRYADPDPHLRIRFRGEPSQLMNAVVPMLCDWASDLMRRGLCQRFGFDSYERELHRYGGVAGTDTAEAVFAADSQFVAEILHLIQDRMVKLDRTILAMIGIDTLLSDVGLSTADRLKWYQSSSHLRAEVGAEYRLRKGAFRAALGMEHFIQAQFGGHALERAIARRHDLLAATAPRLEQLFASCEITQSKSTILASYVHMHCNRLLGIELVHERRVLGLLLRSREGLARAPVRPRFLID